MKLLHNSFCCFSCFQAPEIQLYFKVWGQSRKEQLSLTFSRQSPRTCLSVGYCSASADLACQQLFLYLAFPVCPVSQKSCLRSNLDWQQPIANGTQNLWLSWNFSDFIASLKKSCSGCHLMLCSTNIWCFLTQLSDFVLGKAAWELISLTKSWAGSVRNAPDKQ